MACIVFIHITVLIKQNYMLKYVYNLQQIVKIKGAKLKFLYLFFSGKFNKISLSLIFIIKKIVNPNLFL